MKVILRASRLQGSTRNGKREKCAIDFRFSLDALFLALLQIVGGD
ncbi:hypothetical protein HMPREF9547_00316, partial [Escherichia coli MS 175-1]